MSEKIRLNDVMRAEIIDHIRLKFPSQYQLEKKLTNMIQELFLEYVMVKTPVAKLVEMYPKIFVKYNFDNGAYLRAGNVRFVGLSNDSRDYKDICQRNILDISAGTTKTSRAVKECMTNFMDKRDKRAVINVKPDCTARVMLPYLWMTFGELFLEEQKRLGIDTGFEEVEDFRTLDNLIIFMDKAFPESTKLQDLKHEYSEIKAIRTMLDDATPYIIQSLLDSKNTDELEAKLPSFKEIIDLATGKKVEARRKRLETYTVSTNLGDLSGLNNALVQLIKKDKVDA